VPHTYLRARNENGSIQPRKVVEVLGPLPLREL
jgi:hypothetical protein